MRAVQRGLGYVSLDVFTCTYAYSVLLAIIVFVDFVMNFLLYIYYIYYFKTNFKQFINIGRIEL